jgi:hypothetical protein
MKKIILGFLLLVLVSSFLYSRTITRDRFSYSANYVRYVLGNILIEDDNKSMKLTPWAERVYYSSQYHPVPIPDYRYGYMNPEGGISYGATTVYYNPFTATTEKEYAINFSNGQKDYIYIYVYIVKNSNEYVQIWERNVAERKRGANDRVVKGKYSDGPNYMGVYKIYPNGDKIVIYKIPDLSNSTKVVRVATCPKWKKTTEVYCTQTITIIKGTAKD